VLSAGNHRQPLLLFSRQVLDEMQASWLVARQLYWVFGSWALAAWLRGALPGGLALPAGIGDVLTRLFALPAAIAACPEYATDAQRQGSHEGEARHIKQE